MENHVAKSVTYGTYPVGGWNGCWRRKIIQYPRDATLEDKPEFGCYAGSSFELKGKNYISG
jgi:hypothetical protein